MWWQSMRDHLLIRHFLRRFLDNDLISPDADRHETLATVCAVLISLPLFVTVLLSFKYLGPFPSPGRTAVVALDDRFFYIAGSMIVMALVALAVWNALALDGRDTSILGPLPIPRGRIVRAKLAAVALFASGFVLALNVTPSIIHPAMMVAQFPISVLATPALMLPHAAVTIAAGAFGFLAVLGVREAVQALLGSARFARVSTSLQASLLVCFGTTLLLLPGFSSQVARVWLGSRAVPPYAIPPLWFLGLHEVLAGDITDRLPRGVLPPRILASEQAATAVYKGLRPVFQDLAGLAITALGLAILVVATAYAWNSRRLPAPPVGARTTRSRLGALATKLAQRLLVRHPVAQAGFFFTQQSLSRSLPHRLSMATSAAIGLAAATVSLRGVDVRGVVDLSSTPVAVLAVQFVLIVMLLAGFRYAVRVPAELRANWTFQLSWSGDERPYLAGVKHAALFSLTLPIVLALYPLHAWILGFRVALVHGVAGVLACAVLLEALLLGVRKLPFASRYVPDDRLRVLAPIYVLGFLAATYGLASLERQALSSTTGTLGFLAGLLTVLACLRVVDGFQRRRRRLFAFDELPESTQPLGLSA
jgi:hypothetical protein